MRGNETDGQDMLNDRCCRDENFQDMPLVTQLRSAFADLLAVARLHRVPLRDVLPSETQAAIRGDL